MFFNSKQTLEKNPKEKDIKVELKYNSIYYNEKADIYIAEDAEFNNDIIDNTYTVKLTGILLDIDTEKGYIEIRQDEEHKYYNFKFEAENMDLLIKMEKL